MAVWCFLGRASGDFVAVVVAAVVIMEPSEHASSSSACAENLDKGPEEHGDRVVPILSQHSSLPPWPLEHSWSALETLPTPSPDTGMLSFHLVLSCSHSYALSSVGQLALDSLSTRVGVRLSPDKSGGYYAETKIDVGGRPFVIGLYKTRMCLSSVA
jgi:hypothetical protein